MENWITEPNVAENVQPLHFHRSAPPQAAPEGAAAAPARPGAVGRAEPLPGAGPGREKRALVQQAGGRHCLSCAPGPARGWDRGTRARPVPSLTQGDTPRQELGSSSAIAMVSWSILSPLLRELEKRDLLTTGALLGVFLLFC